MTNEYKQKPFQPVRDYATQHQISVQTVYNLKIFNLSSNLGYITKKGEQSYISLRPNGGSDLVINKTNLGYLSINTTIDIKYPIRNLLIPFVSVGPRIDYLISDKSESRWDILKHTVYGITFGGGLKYNISKMQIGLKIKVNL